MNYRKIKDKWVINKNGVYISLTKEELEQLKSIIMDIESGENKLYVDDARKT